MSIRVAGEGRVYGGRGGCRSRELRVAVSGGFRLAAGASVSLPSESPEGATADRPVSPTGISRQRNPW